MKLETVVIQGEMDEASNAKVKSHVPLSISQSQRSFLSNGDSNKGFSGKVKAAYGKMRNFNNGPGRVSLSSPSAKFWRIADLRDETSRALGSTGSHLKDKINGVLSRKIDWVSLRKLCKEWIRNPINMALFAWIVCVAVSGAILFLVMTGMLNAAIPKKSDRNTWFEVNNQILNALFTLMCLYQHPKRIYHLILLIRWVPEDIKRLRNVYCKNGTYKPHEWAHMMVAVALLNLNCFAQYALCGLNLGYKRSERPAIGVGICISVAIGAPAIAGLYCIMSPLGREYGEEEGDEESHIRMASPLRPHALQKRYSFASNDEHRIIETRPQWSGGIFDFWDDISTAYLSLFCTFCVFGWNMERLGFGNMYVHIATFLLFCMAPFFIFNLAAINIDNEAVRIALGFTGIVLCVFGLLYGGFWRIQMRKRFNLPGSAWRPAVTDCALWLCCCWCALAQEVRTGNAYDIVEEKFCRKVEETHNDGSYSENNGGHHQTPSATSITIDDSSNSPKFHTAATATELVHSNDEAMLPPVAASIQREEH